MPQYTLSQKLEAFRRLMKDGMFENYNSVYEFMMKKGMEREAAELDKEKEDYIIETYPELFG